MSQPNFVLLHIEGIGYCVENTITNSFLVYGAWTALEACQMAYRRCKDGGINEEKLLKTLRFKIPRCAYCAKPAAPYRRTCGADICNTWWSQHCND